MTELEILNKKWAEFKKEKGIVEAARIIRMLKSTKVREYSHQQKMAHNSYTLFDHVMVNLRSPRNTYYITAFSGSIPEDYPDFIKKFIRIAKRNTYLLEENYIGKV